MSKYSFKEPDHFTLREQIKRLGLRPSMTVTLTTDEKLSITRWVDHEHRIYFYVLTDTEKFKRERGPTGFIRRRMYQ